MVNCEMGRHGQLDVVFVGWRESVERYSLQLEVLLVRAGRAENVASVDGECQCQHCSGVAALAWHNSASSSEQRRYQRPPLATDESPRRWRSQRGHG